MSIPRSPAAFLLPLSTDPLAACYTDHPAADKMASQGSSLQNYNNELVACIDDLRSKREEVNRSILRDEEEKAKIQKELTTMTERLSRINEDLARKMQARNEFDQTIQETEAAYMKILESSQTLLNVLKREAINLQKKRGASS